MGVRKDLDVASRANNTCPPTRIFWAFLGGPRPQVDLTTFRGLFRNPLMGLDTYIGARQLLLLQSSASTSMAREYSWAKITHRMIMKEPPKTAIIRDSGHRRFINQSNHSLLSFLSRRRGLDDAIRKGSVG